MAFGAGVNYQGLKLDLATSWHSVLGFTPQIGLSYKFGKTKLVGKLKLKKIKERMLSIHKKYFLFLFLFVLQNFYLLAQSPAPAHQEDADNIINQNVEILAEDLQSEDADFTNLTDQLKYFASNPINLNQTNKEELISLGLLSEIQIISLLSHINKNGKLITKYELQSVNGFDLRTIRKISYFIKVDDNFANGNFTLLDALKGGSHEIVSRIQRIIETQSGYKTRPPDSLINFDTPDSFYLGSPNRMFVRYRYTYRNNISIGFIAENDAGEAFRSIPSINKKAGFDFYTAHLFIKILKISKHWLWAIIKLHLDKD